MSDHTPLPTDRPSTGIGFRTPHHADLVASRPAVGLLEIHAENYLGGGAALHQLEALAKHWPISVHAVGLTLGTADGIDRHHLQRIAALVERLDPPLVSELLSWSVADGIYLNDLLPIPYTEEALAVVARNVAIVQDRLNRRILIENPSRYLRFVHSAMSEEEFLVELASRTGCGLLCDVNNIFVSCANVGGNPAAWIDALPPEAVGEIHLAGHCANEVDGAVLLIDDHGSPVQAPVWALFERAIRRFSAAPVLIEWDSNLPDLATLVAEATRADRRRNDALSEVHHAYAA